MLLLKFEISICVAVVCVVQLYYNSFRRFFSFLLSSAKNGSGDILIIMLNSFSHSGPVFCLSSFVDRGEVIAVSGGKETDVHVWDIKSSTERAIVATGHNSHINAIDISGGDDPFLCSGSYDGTVRLYGLRGETFPPMNHGNAVFQVKIIEHQSCLVTCGQYGKIKVWDLTTSLLVRYVMSIFECRKP
jgi:WD40 repeat protein